MINIEYQLYKGNNPMIKKILLSTSAIVLCASMGMASNWVLIGDTGYINFKSGTLPSYSLAKIVDNKFTDLDGAWIYNAELKLRLTVINSSNKDLEIKFTNNADESSTIEGRWFHVFRNSNLRNQVSDCLVWGGYPKFCK